MNKKLGEYRLKWHRPKDKTPDMGQEVLVRFRGKEHRFAAMVYDPRYQLWNIPAHEKFKGSGAYSSREIFAWSALPTTLVGAFYGEME